MAQKVQVLLVDDIDGGEADETVTFALDGKTYEIDLTTGNGPLPPFPLFFFSIFLPSL